MEREIILTDQAPAPIGPYSQAVLVGNTLYISGQIPINPESGTLIEESIEAETHQVMKNLEGVLKAAGMSFSNLVKTTIFIKDMNDFSRINVVYGNYFTDIFPARETVEVSRLPKDVRVEISGIAVR
jgi:2-iminobutanoate/2-iminopropanoate deaminase